MCRNLVLLCIVTSTVFTAQQPTVLHYLQIQEKYSHLPENDARALPPIRKSIALGKKIQNFRHLVYAYEDAAYYSRDRQHKLLYSDSIVQTAKRTGDAGIISKAFLAKGIIYYFNYRKYDKALDQYLSAAAFANQTGDEYLIFKIKYNIGVVKSFLGFHGEALTLFKACSHFFESKMKESGHPTLQYNNTRGYLNSLHQMSISYRHLQQWQQADSILSVATPFRRIKEYRQEDAYFLKEQGIAAFRQKLYSQSIDSLLAAAEILREKEEDAYLTVAYYYTGKAYHHLKNAERTREYLTKVDSLFLKNQTVLPETRATYEFFVKNTDYQKNPSAAGYYIDQLLKADSILNRDLPYLSARLHREYDTKAIQAERDQLLHAKKWGDSMMIISLILGSAFGGFLIISRKRRKVMLRNYHNLQVKLSAEQQISTPAGKTKDASKKLWYEPDAAGEILQKLRAFEDREGFLDENLTVITLAAQLEVSKNNLSYVVNEHLDMNFNAYLNALRIRYITAKMNSDREYLKLKTPELAKKCGIKTRQHFSRLFYEHNNIRPSDYIELRKKQLKNTL